VILVALAACACNSAPTASTEPSPSPTPTSTPSQAASPSSSGLESPVPAQVLSPAQGLPIGNLCSTQITVQADGNAAPLFCRSGALNVPAWRFYADISASVLGLGLNPTAGQVQAAICDDIAHNHATRAQETSGYKLATAYYGWTFNIDVSKTVCT